MATVRFLIKDPKKNPSAILIRFTNGRAFDFKRSTGLLIDPKYWSNKKGSFKNASTSEDLDELASDLKLLESHVLKSYTADYRKGITIDSSWLKSTVNRYHKQDGNKNLDYLSEYAQHYIESLPNRVNSSTGRSGAAKETEKKYKSVLSLIRRFEEAVKKKYRLTEVGLNFQNRLIEYLRFEGYSDNYIGRLIGFIKTFCRDARANGYEVSNQLDLMKKFTKRVSFVTLDDDEISSIYNLDLSSLPFLENARDWMIIGLYTGQRVSDFLEFNRENLVGNNKLEFSQKKTGAIMEIPVHPRILQVLEKNKGFPRKISSQNFNEYIKQVCEKAEIDEMLDGELFDKESKRKKHGKYPKYKLISSHVCRRSFATNHFGKLPTPQIMYMTGHRSEKEFLRYIGKREEEYINEIQEYWAKETYEL